ncbi:MAG: DUF262 domain-containing protein [Prevotella sp.]|jgi:hypothetical protein|nr:DUF262 domain-containing protein [Prevotella sp.]
MEKHTVNWLNRQNTDSKLNKNISIQRREVWDAEKKSNLIVSLLLDIPIESLLFEESEDKSYNVLDGKQRTLTLCSFLDDGFKLSPKIRLKELEGLPLVGLCFSDLSDKMRQQILEYELSIAILRPLDSDERATVFFMRNQAVSLSKIDLSIVVLGEKAMDMLTELCNHNFMANKVKLTAPAQRKHDDISILLQYLILRNRPKMGFSGAELMSFCDDIKNGEAEILNDDLTSYLNYLDSAIPEKKKYLKKVHMPLILYSAQLAKEKNIPLEVFGGRLNNFFDSLSAESEYMTACQSGSAKRSNIQARMKILIEYLDISLPLNEHTDNEPIQTVARRGRKKKAN